MRRVGLLVLGITIVMSFGISELLLALDSNPGSMETRNKQRIVRNPELWPKMDENFKNIFWIVQISDVHISLFRDLARGPDLIRLCEEYIKLINPETVIVTGDLTDAKIQDSIDTMQIKDEWITYQNIVEKCSAMVKGKWVDIRGNHDCFDVNDYTSRNNFYRGSIMYLCGHLHTLGDLVPRMYAKHKTGQLELELGDWKDNRVFRVIAFDNDLVSFTDVKLGQWPIILITNPKDNQFLSPSVEPVEMIYFSTHIRILVFSPVDIKHVSAHVDGQYQGKAKQAKENSPLYVIEWNPKQFAKGTHKITVTVVTMDKNTAFAHQYFSVDGQESGFSLMPRLLLMLNIYTVAKGLFGLMVFAYVTAFTVLRQCSNIRPYLSHRGYWPHLFLNSLLMRTWLASRVTSICSLLVGSVVYLAFGPWFAGYLLTDHYLTFTIPLTLIVGHILDQRRNNSSKFPLRQHILFVMFTLVFYYFLIFLASGEFVRAYGKMAFLVGPLRTGNLVLLPLAVCLALKADVKVAPIISTF
ncbi:transmembrane protein 62 [Elysia marginata]|uniref:Transmembrane protein 62 n=1 Tax=Elysia marginata TaxID=1093978 RepID=A0AAV4JMJ6_9GAST|nr:transmembrane protein 62 [Elysia marginata]